MRSNQSFRCVCGFAFGLEPETGVKCTECGRYFSPEWLAHPASGAETTYLQPGGAHERAASDECELLKKKEQVGHFQILSTLGHGAMGTVYHAVDMSLQRSVAIKVLRSGSKEVTEQRNAILQEARLQARLNHPHIVSVYYVATDDEIPFFAMEYVDGLSLEDRLANAPIHFEELLSIALQLAEALNHTAELGVVHGDIKPANILLSPSGTAKLSDFGLAKPSEETSHIVGGTLNYVAPEVVRGKQPTFHSDMYSLGVTLFQATFGHVPVRIQECKDLRAVLHAKEQEDVSFPSQWPASIPPPWQGVLSALLKPQPEDRPPSYESILKTITNLRPRSLPDSGYLPRLLAWYVDNTLLFALLALPSFVAANLAGLTVEGYSEAQPMFATILAVAVFPIPILGHILQAKLETSPGKKLFRIRIVDAHGLPPNPSKLFLRATFQLLPVWALATVAVVGNIRLVGLIQPIAWVGSIVFALDSLAVFLSPRGRTMHDRIFGTRVVVDVGDA